MVNIACTDSLAKTVLRVPVVIYNNLDRTEESRLFIDINTKQRPVPNELLLDIKSLAEYENDAEQLLRDTFDRFSADPKSPLLGLLSPASKVPGKLTRVSFNAAFKPLIPTFGEADTEMIFLTTRNYLEAFAVGLESMAARKSLVNPITFRAIMSLFPEVAQRVKDRFAATYTTENFSAVLAPIFGKVKGSTFLKPGSSVRSLHDVLFNLFTKSFTL